MPRSALRGLPDSRACGASIPASPSSPARAAIWPRSQRLPPSLLACLRRERQAWPAARRHLPVLVLITLGVQGAGMGPDDRMGILCGLLVLALSTLVLREHLNGLQWAGGVLILGATLAGQIAEWKRTLPGAAEEPGA